MERYRPHDLAVHQFGTQGRAEGRFTARTDLAAGLLALAGDDSCLHKTVGIITAVGNPSFMRIIRKEGFAGR